MIPHEQVYKLLYDNVECGEQDAEEYIETCLDHGHWKRELDKLNEHIDFVYEIAKDLQIREMPLPTKSLEDARTVARLDFLNAANRRRETLQWNIHRQELVIDNFHAAYQQMLLDLTGDSLVNPRDNDEYKTIVITQK